MNGNVALAKRLEDNAFPRIGAGSPIYNRLLDALHDEAWLLDEIRLNEWFEMLAEDVTYIVPLRHTVPLATPKLSVVSTTAHMHDNRQSIAMRVGRLTKTKSAFAEDPPSRTRRQITNVRVWETEKTDEFSVSSYLFMTRSRCESPDYHLLSGERRDVWRKVGEEFKLVHRTVLLDQSVIGQPNLAVFL